MAGRQRTGLVDLTGRTFGHLTVIGQEGRAPLGRTTEVTWRCKCDCGNDHVVRNRHLKRARPISSCGCRLHTERVRHGATLDRTRTPEYRVWSAMIERCESKASKNYKNYGAIGRTVCERWHRFENFIADMGTRPSAKHTLERSDNNRGYSPDNCRWATRKEQMRNVSYNRNLTFNGRTQCMSAWAEELGVGVLLIWKRLNRGWSVDRALTTPKMTNQFG